MRTKKDGSSPHLFACLLSIWGNSKRSVGPAGLKPSPGTFPLLILKIAVGSTVQVLPQDVTAVLVLFPATDKKAPMHQQDLVPFMPSLELDNQTLPEEAYAFILPF